MIYRNDNIKITSDYVEGSIKDLKEYFRYQIASQCMTGEDCDYNVFKNVVDNIIGLLDGLYERTDSGFFTDEHIVKVSEHPMGGYIVDDEVIR